MKQSQFKIDHSIFTVCKVIDTDDFFITEHEKVDTIREIEKKYGQREKIPNTEIISGFPLCYQKDTDEYHQAAEFRNNYQVNQTKYINWLVKD